MVTRRGKWELAAVAFLLLSCVVWCMVQLSHAHSQRDAVQRIASVRGLVRYDWQPADPRYLGHYLPMYDLAHPSVLPEPAWLRDHVGDDCFQTVVAVAVRCRDTDRVLSDSISRLPRLEELYLDGSDVTDAGMRCISALPRLRVLALEKTPISDAGIAECASATSLEYLSFAATHITDVGLESLSSLRHLRRLNASATDITDNGVLSIASIKSLESLELLKTSVSNKCLSRLAGLPLLKEL